MLYDKIIDDLFARFDPPNDIGLCGVSYGSRIRNPERSAIIEFMNMPNGGTLTKEELARCEKFVTEECQRHNLRARRVLPGHPGIASYVLRPNSEKPSID